MHNSTSEVYTICVLPQSEDITEYEWFLSECIPITDEYNINKFGPHSYVVPVNRYIEIIKDRTLND